MNSAREKNREYWDSGKPGADESYGMGTGDPVETEYRHFSELRHLKKIVPFSKTMDVLELGCGTGRWALSLAPEVRSWTGIDFSRQAIETATGRARERNITNARFIGGALQDVPCPGRFDVIYFSGSAQYLENEELAAVLRKIAACLKEGGIVVDRSTVNYRATEFVDTAFRAWYRTPAEIAGLYAAAGFSCQYRNRSYRFLRFPRILLIPPLNRLFRSIFRWTGPVSFIILEAISSAADTVLPVPFEGGDRDHLFLLFRANRDSEAP